jgi:hypothetical protein
MNHGLPKALEKEQFAVWVQWNIVSMITKPAVRLRTTAYFVDWAVMAPRNNLQSRRSNISLILTFPMHQNHAKTHILQQLPHYNQHSAVTRKFVVTFHYTGLSRYQVSDSKEY